MSMARQKIILKIEWTYQNTVDERVVVARETEQQVLQA